MEPVMKISDHLGITHYIFHPERVAHIHDVGKPDKPAAILYFDGPSYEVHTRFRVDGFTARDLKRTIQENASEKLGFLKLNYSTNEGDEHLRRYVNVDHIVSVTAARITRQVDGKSVTLGGANVNGLDFAVTVEGAAFAIAAQIRRVLKRLDQDEEFCCAPEDAEVEDAPEAESE